MRARLGSMPVAQWIRIESQASAIRSALSSTLCTISGLKTLSWKCPCEPAKATAASLPNTWTQTIVSASHCVGFTLPGMIELPGSFSGIEISPMPHRGPEASQRMSLAILKRAIARPRSAALTSTMASWAARAENLFGADTNGWPVSLAI